MHKRSLLVGFGLGLLLAGILGVISGAHGRWHDRYDAPVVSETARGVDQAAYYQTSRFAHHGAGMFVPFMMMFFCVVPIVFLTFMGVMFKVMHRIKHRMHHRWNHGHGHHGGTPTFYV